nr:methyltransferase domain-containing protein [Desulfobaculum xiamenense]
MTCHAQAAELLAAHVRAGDSVLDAGCGSGAFWHSLVRRGLDVRYVGIDAASSLVAIGREIMPEFGLAAENLRVLRIEDMAGEVDHVVCLNVLSNIDNYHRPLERLLRVARRTLILRESAWDGLAVYAYVRDRHLDSGVKLNVHVNTYNAAELMDFMRGYGFEVARIQDRRTQGRAETVIGHPHYWTFFVAVRTDTKGAK